MAFVSEIRARLGLDTTPFSRALTKTQADVGRAAQDMGKKLQRSFGAGDLFKGLLQGIGIGSVQAIIDTVTAPFRRGAEDAERMANESAAMLDVFRQQQLALAGQAQRFDILKKKVSELNQDIKIQERVVSELNDDPLILISEDARTKLKEAKDELSRLRIEAAKADAQVKTEIALTNRRTDEWAAASLQREQMRKLELDLLNEESETIKEIQRSELRLFQVSESLAAERKKGSISTSETNALLEEQSQLLDRITTLGRIRTKEEAAARQSALADAAALGQGMTGRPIGAGGGRAAGLRPRGRTESERIADRAALNLAATQDALAKGDVTRAGSRANAAAADFIRAGSMQARAAAGISPETANIIGGDIKAAVDSLKAIQSSLLPTQTR
jgi:hypothetical protein